MSQIPSMPETIDILRLSPEATLPTRAHADEAEWAEIAAEVDREEAFGYPAPRVARDCNREAAEADARRLMAEWEKEDREREIAASLSWNSTFGSSRRPDAPASPSAGSIPGWGEMSFEQRRAVEQGDALMMLSGMARNRFAIVAAGGSS
jgi:hypothetical protein